MPTILSHPAATLVAPWFRGLPRRAIVFGAIASILPDLDVIAFAFGIPYASTFGHRGFTHSIVFALVVATIFTALARRTITSGTVEELHSRTGVRSLSRATLTFAFLFLCAISHPLLDAMTDGGLGIAFFSPFSNHRYFLPWRPIRVSPIGADAFFTARGLVTLASEMAWVWVPFGVAWVIAKVMRYFFGNKASSTVSS